MHQAVIRLLMPACLEHAHLSSSWFLSAPQHQSRAPQPASPSCSFLFSPFFLVGVCVENHSHPLIFPLGGEGWVGGASRFRTHFPFLEQIRFVFIFPLMGDNYPQCQKKEVFAAFKVDIKPERYVLIDGSHFVIIPFYDRRVSAWKSDLYSWCTCRSELMFISC